MRTPAQRSEGLLGGSASVADTVAGLAAVFNLPSEDLGFTEHLDSRCLDDADMSQCVAVFNHNTDAILGALESGTLDLSVNGSGLA